MCKFADSNSCSVLKLITRRIGFRELSACPLLLKGRRSRF